MSALFRLHGQLQYILGINYLPPQFGHSGDFWKRPDYAGVEADLRKIKAAGIGAIRLPLPITVMTKAPDLDQGVIAGFEKILALADGIGLKVVPNLFHTGGFWKTDWLTSETAFCSDEVLGHEKTILAAFVTPHKNDPRIIAWDICNEPWWIFGTAWQKDAERFRPQLRSWVAKFCAAMRALGASQPLTIGVDHAGICQEVGADVDAIAANVDFTSPHFYSRYIIGEILIDETNTLRDTYYGPFNFARATPRGKPGGCFEFGNSTQFISEAKQAPHMRVALYSSLAAGANLWFPWVYQDFAPSDYKDYNHQPHELCFGMWRADGSPKPAVAELTAFAQTLGHLQAGGYERALPTAALLCPRDWYGNLKHNAKAYFNAFCLAREAGFAVDFVPITGDLSPYQLLISPTTDYHLDELHKIRDYVSAGGTLLMSPTNLYLVTRHIQEVFGVITEEVLNMPTWITTRAEVDLPFLPAGKRMTFFSSQLTGTYQYHFTPNGCQVLLRDTFGRPALTRHAFGKGTAMALSFPLEYAMAVIPHAHQTLPAYTIYAAAAAAANLKSPVHAAHPQIETALLHGQDSLVAIFINHEPTPITAPVDLATSFESITSFPDGKPVADPHAIALAPSGVALIRYAR